DQLWWGWRLLKDEPTNTLPPAPPGEPLRGVASGRCVDVPGFSTAPGTSLDLWDCNNGGNQSWNYTTAKELTVYADKCMTAGPDVTIENCTGATNQVWDLNADQTITSPSAPTQCLAAVDTGNGAAVVTAPCDGSDNQKWTR
ncbi:MAG TPA: RICIN domain-containing protein, partial [Kribbella sp.]|nr:RICIN domain-containing protein [Kribbella sp.]